MYRRSLKTTFDNCATFAYRIPAIVQQEMFPPLWAEMFANKNNKSKWNNCWMVANKWMQADGTSTIHTQKVVQNENPQPTIGRDTEKAPHRQSMHLLSSMKCCEAWTHLYIKALGFSCPTPSEDIGRSYMTVLRSGGRNPMNNISKEWPTQSGPSMQYKRSFIGPVLPSLMMPYWQQITEFLEWWNQYWFPWHIQYNTQTFIILIPHNTKTSMTQIHNTQTSLIHPNIPQHT